jgi:Zn-dependent metalloprotease
MQLFCIVPSYILRSIVMNGDEHQRQAAWSTLTASEQFRGERRVLTLLTPGTNIMTGTKRRTVYDARHGYVLPGRLVRGEKDAKSKDPAVNEAFDGSGATYDFFYKVFGRRSIDCQGRRLDSSVHYGIQYDNAFWNGHQMVYGDGDGRIFRRFTGALDVIGHELTHGLIQYEANLSYRGQSGALNESCSDVFGSLVKQYKQKQTAAEANWLIGDRIFMPGVHAKGMRSLSEPGTAYDDPLLGRDPQPAHMQDYVHTVEDGGGVHINSGIPNRAFYLLAVRLGGFAWEKAGRIWYRALCDKLREDSSFVDAMNMTVGSAGEIYGSNSREQKATREAWSDVGI